MITLSNVEKEYAVNGDSFFALQQVDLEIGRGELVFIVGPSGSGKSTLLNIIAGIDRPTRGAVQVDGHALHELDEDSLSKFRGNNVGVVFQFFQLLPTLTVRENLLLAMDFVGKVHPKERYSRADELLELVGVTDQADKLPTALSGGQQQRVAIARALANDPQLLVADEPTGNLDSKTTVQVMKVFEKLHEAGTTLILVTHNPDLGLSPSRLLTISDGRVV